MGEIVVILLMIFCVVLTVWLWRRFYHYYRIATAPRPLPERGTVEWTLLCEASRRVFTDREWATAMADLKDLSLDELYEQAQELQRRLGIPVYKKPE